LNQGLPPDITVQGDFDCIQAGPDGPAASIVMSDPRQARQGSLRAASSLAFGVLDLPGLSVRDAPKQ
jgi:hypothetical protein